MLGFEVSWVYMILTKQGKEGISYPPKKANFGARQVKDDN
jgi:hypothetical protein